MLLGLLALAGCQDGPQHIGSDDPMRGGALTAQAGPTGPAPPTSPAGALPGLPAPASTTSTAALTTVDQSLESEPSLRIPGTPVSLQGSGNQAIMIQAPQPLDPRPPGPPPSDGGFSGFPGPGNDGAVQLGPPVAADSAHPAPDQGFVPVGGPAPKPSTQELLDALHQRGATWTMEPQPVPGTDLWKFKCSIRDRNDPSGVTYLVFETEGAGDAGQGAIRNMLTVIDQHAPH